jgi:ribosomal protein L11 methyltransferase
MPFLQVVIDIGDRDPAAVEEACFASGALSVTLTDAADEPVLEPAPGTTPLWKAIRLTALFADGADGPARVATLEAATGLGPGAIRCESLADRAWEREWLKDFHPLRFGRRLWVCPGGQPAPDPAAVILELDPGLAFGTGTHQTTAMCLEWLDGADLAGRTVLDFGCGSGILALAALKLGAASAIATDIDPQALLATRENAARNHLESRIRICLPDSLPEAHGDVVLANILAGPLVELAPQLAAATSPEGRILLAGMLESQAESVADAYRPWFHMTQFASREGWTVLTGTRPGPVDATPVAAPAPRQRPPGSGAE